MTDENYDPEYNEIDWDQPYRLDDSPVIPLGHFNHQQFFFLTASGGVVSLTLTEFNRNSIYALVNGKESWLIACHPEIDDDLEKTGNWDADDATKELIGQCLTEGPIFKAKIRHMIQTDGGLPILFPVKVWPFRSMD